MRSHLELLLILRADIPDVSPCAHVNDIVHRGFYDVTGHSEHQPEHFGASKPSRYQLSPTQARHCLGFACEHAAECWRATV